MNDNAWNVTVDTTSSPPVLLDLEGDGVLDIVVGDTSGKVTVYDAEGNMGWQVGAIQSSIVGLAGVEAPTTSILALSSGGVLASIDGLGQEAWAIDLGSECDRPFAAGDVDGDLEMEVVVTLADGRILLVDTHEVMKRHWPMAGHDQRNTRALSSDDDGQQPVQVKWSSHMFGPSMVLVGDIDGDGPREVIGFHGPGASKGDMYIWEANGKIRTNMSMGSYIAPPLLADVAGNQGKEIITPTISGVQARKGDMTLVWDHPMGDPVSVAAADVMGDGRYEVFVGNVTGDIVALYAENGTPIWNDKLGAELLSMAVADLASDGTAEAIMVTGNNIMYIRNATDGAPRWASKVLTGLPVPPVIADLDGDASTDIVIGTDQGQLMAYSGDGDDMWETTLQGAILSLMAIHGDDGGMDLAVVTDAQAFHLVDGDNGSMIRKISIPEVGNGTETTAVVLGPEDMFTIVLYLEGVLLFIEKDGNVVLRMDTNAKGPPRFDDLDRDGMVEMVYGVSDHLVAREMGAGPGPLSPWAMAGHDAGRTYNPFSFDGLFLPDLLIGPEAISFDPPLINEDGTHTVQVEFRNNGPVATGPFTINVTSEHSKVTSIDIASLPPFTEANVTFPWAVVYENQTLKVELDRDDTVKEVDETNNIAKRPLFMNMAPEAKAGPDRRVEPGVQVGFDGTGSSDPDGTIINYTWDLDDGGMAYGPIVIHTFDSSGIFNVTLMVTDRYGLTDIDNATIRVNFAPLFLEWSPKAGLSINEGEFIDFYIMATDPDGDQITIDWYLDGTKMAEGPTWSFWADYSSAGARKVKAVASDGNLSSTHEWDINIMGSIRLIESATPDSPVAVPQGSSETFTVVLSQGAQGSAIEWALDGDPVQVGKDTFRLHVGETSKGKYELMVELTGDNGRDFHVWDIIIGPVEDKVGIRWAYPEGQKVHTNAGDPVWFGISAEGGDIQWYIDGVAVLGDSGPGFKFDHWANTSYNVTVRVSSAKASVSRSWDVTVNHPPLPVINASKVLVGKGKKVKFDAGASRDHEAKGNISSYSWDFGDGKGDVGRHTSHSYGEAGTYKVTLTVTDGEGLSAEASVNIMVRAEPETTPGFTSPILIFTFLSILIMMRRRRPVI
jgi:outer membrane protein assembly factor BamB